MNQRDTTRTLESNQKNKFLEIHNIMSGKENGTTFKISIKKQKYFTLFDTGAEISVINSVAFKQLGLFDKLYDSNILVCTMQVGKVWIQKVR